MATKSSDTEKHLLNISTSKQGPCNATDLLITVGGKELSVNDVVIDPLKPNEMLTATIKLNITLNG